MLNGLRGNALILKAQILVSEAPNKDLNTSTEAKYVTLFSGFHLKRRMVMCTCNQFLVWYARRGTQDCRVGPARGGR